MKKEECVPGTDPFLLSEGDCARNKLPVGSCPNHAAKTSHPSSALQFSRQFGCDERHFPYSPPLVCRTESRDRPGTLSKSYIFFSPRLRRQWVTTLQTNQKALENNEVEVASKSLRIFSMHTKKQALSLASAWTPPKMLPMRTQIKCHICQNKFGPFRRACHCRNYGVVVCLKDCANQVGSLLALLYCFARYHHSSHSFRTMSSGLPK